MRISPQGVFDTQLRDSMKNQLIAVTKRYKVQKHLIKKLNLPGAPTMLTTNGS
jgi:hypothetical protein